MRGSTRQRGLWLGAVITATLVLLAGCTSGVDSFDVVTSRGRSVSDLFLWTIIIAAIIFVGIAIAVAYILIRYHDRPGAPAPRPNRHVHRFQIAWISAMVVLFAIFAGFMFHSMNIIGAPAAPSALRVTVIGHQWWWEYQYPDLHVTTANELHVPAGRPLQLTFQTSDVIHSFWVPQFGWKMDALPQRSNEMAFTIDKPGYYQGTCTEFCGAQHAWMRLRVYADTPDQFDAWVKQHQQPAAPPQSELARSGEQVFLDNTCISCHTVAGTSANANIGPNLTHFASRETIGTGIVTNNPTNLTQWIRDAGSIKPHVLMPGFPTLSDDQLKALVAWLEGLK